MNRYSQYSTSEFNPLSFNELAAAPTMMRQKHDNSITQAEAMRIKADPLEVHLNRAIELKRQMDNEIAKNVDSLNKEGYNPTTFQNITRLNRQYQDLISPTGEIGQINAAKTIYNTNQEEFIKDAAKQNIGRDQAIKKWKEKTNYYTGFGDDGESITNVDPQGVAQFQDYEKYKKTAKDLMGKIETEVRSGNYTLRDSGLGNGTKVGIDSKGFKVESTNIDALNNAILAGSEMWLKPTGEGYKYNQDAGVDQNNFRQRFIGDFGSMLETVNKHGYEENGQFINDASGPNGGSGNLPTTPSAIYDPSTQKTLASEIKETDYSKIGTNRSSTGGVPGQFKQNTGKVKIGYKDLLKDPLSQRLYEKSYDRLVAAGKIPKGADKNSEAVGKIVGLYMTKHTKIPTIANDVIQPDTSTNSQQFMGQFDKKEGVQRDAEAQANLESGYRTIIDPVTKEELTKKEFLAKGYTVKYDGYDSHLSYNNYNFKGDNNENQSILTHKVRVYKDGKPLGVTAMTRTRQEMNSPEFKKSYQIGHIYRNAVQQFGDWVVPTATDNTKVKFKENGKFDIIYNGHKYEDVTGPEYEFIIDKAISEKEHN